MRTAQKIKNAFNLLQPKSEPPTAWDNIYAWVVDKARIAMILAEIVIVIVFAAKVIVDTQSKGLDDTLTQLDQQIRFNYNASEPRIRTLQQKVKSYEGLWQKSSSYAGLFAEVVSYVGGLGAAESKLSITFNGTELDVTGFANKDAVVSLETSMKKSPNFTDVELFEVKSEGEDVNTGNSGFGLRAQIKQLASRQL